MASIPGPVIFVIGLVVSGVSFFLNKKSFAFNGPYTLFLYLGLILIFYGFVKIMIWYITRKSKEEKIVDQKKDIKPGGVNPQQQGMPQGVNNQQPQNQYNNQQQNFTPAQLMENQLTSGKGQDSDRYQYVLKCRNCGLTHYAAYANFCQNCGTRLK